MLRLLGLLATLLIAAPATAQVWQPDRPIRLVIGYTPGVLPDLVGRMMAGPLARRLGQPVVVENRPGAGGTLGADVVARAAPDGLTLGAIPAAPLALSPHLLARVPYDPLRDFTPIGEFAAFASFVVVHPSVPATNLAELAAWLRAQQGRVTCNGATVGSLLHISMAMLIREWGVECPMSHYVQAAQPDLLSGRTPVGVDNVGTTIGAVRGGQLRALAVTSRQRLPSFPEVPAVAETIPSFEALSWVGLYGPRGLPAPVVARLEAALAEAAAEAEVVARIDGMGGFMLPGGAAALATRLAAEHARWGQVIRENGIRLD